MADLPTVTGNVTVENQNLQNKSMSLAEGMVLSLQSNTIQLTHQSGFLNDILGVVRKIQKTLDLGLKSSRLDAGTVQGNAEKVNNDDLNSKFGSMLESLTKAFSGMGAGKKSMLGVAALLGGLALINKYSDELVELIAPILKYFNETLIPNLKELNQIILDAPGGYFTLLGATGLIKTLFDFFGKGGKIAKVIDDTTDGIKALKVTDLLDDLTVRKVTWGARLRTAFMGRMTGLFGRIGGIFTSIGTSIRAMGVLLIDDLAVALKTLTPTWLRVLKLQVIGGETIYPITKGGGKQIGIVGKVSQSIAKITAALSNLNPFKGLGTSLKTLGASWKLALSGALFGTAAGSLIFVGAAIAFAWLSKFLFNALSNFFCVSSNDTPITI